MRRPHLNPARIVPAIGLGIALLLAACAKRADAPDAGVPEATIRTVTTAPGVSLEVVDWGGRGPALVFLAGLGNTAHVFDDFAPQFTDSFHVLGITRRGFGASAATVPPGNVDTLVADIVAVLDSLRLDSVVLVGHSIAGEEMSRFAETLPGRCAGLVYLDAAYDRRELGRLFQAHPQPTPPPMQAADSASPAAVRAYSSRLFAVEFPLSEIRALSRFDAGGRYLGEVTPDSLVGRVMGAIVEPRYDRIQCRSLALYAVADSTPQVLPFYAALDSAGRRDADALFEAFTPVGSASRARFRQQAGNQVIEMPRANHYLFLQRPAQVASAMRAFLLQR